MYMRPVKRFGQNFLVNGAIARIEAAHAIGRGVIEIGPGYGILTKELCKVADSVIAVERDRSLFRHLKSAIKSRKLTLINADFFGVPGDEIIRTGNEILISNVPYNLSSKTIEWLAEKGIEAVLCLQKEFVDRMLAKHGSDDYSRLSVTTSLMFSVTRIINVGRGNFRPMPKVDSAIVYMKPKKSAVSREDLRIIGLLMQHKNKTLKKAVVDSRRSICSNERAVVSLSDTLKLKSSRVFALSPDELLGVSRDIQSFISGIGNCA